MGDWRVWCYAIRTGWENTDGYATREEALDIRSELIDWDGYPADWVTVRRSDHGPPKRQPSQTSIQRVTAQLKVTPREGKS